MHPEEPFARRSLEPYERQARDLVKPHSSDGYHDIVRLLVSKGATVDPHWLAETSVRGDRRMRAVVGAKA